MTAAGSTVADAAWTGRLPCRHHAADVSGNLDVGASVINQPDPDYDDIPEDEDDDDDDDRDHPSLTAAERNPSLK